jgi:hypothetical protein
MSPRRLTGAVLEEHGPHTRAPQLRQLNLSLSSCASPWQVVCHVKLLWHLWQTVEASKLVHSGGLHVAFLTARTSRRAS